MWYVWAFAYTLLGLASTTKSEGLNTGTRSDVTSSGFRGTPWSSLRLKFPGEQDRSEIFHNLTVLSKKKKEGKDANDYKLQFGMHFYFVQNEIILLIFPAENLYISQFQLLWLLNVIYHQFGIIANIIKDLLQALNLRKRDLGLKTCFNSWIDLL